MRSSETVGVGAWNAAGWSWVRRLLWSDSSDLQGHVEELARDRRAAALVGLMDSAKDALADALDAAVCVLAGRDFIRGHALSPPDLDEAKREGWIWVVAGMASRH